MIRDGIKVAQARLARSLALLDALDTDEDDADQDEQP